MRTAFADELDRQLRSAAALLDAALTGGDGFLAAAARARIEELRDLAVRHGPGPVTG